MNMKKIVYITILFSCVLAHTRDASNSITSNQETTEKPSFLEKTKEKLGNFGRHLLDIPKYIFGRWVNRGKTAEENLAVSVDENQIEQKKSNSSSLRSYKNGIKEDSDEEQFAIETTDEQMNENNSNIRNDNKNLKSKINLQHNDDQDLIQTKSVFRNDLTNVNEHSDNNLVTSNISSTTNEEKTQNKNTQASVPSVIWKENDDFLNELKQNNASQETTDKSSFLEKTKEQLGNFGRHLLDIPKYIFGRWVNRGKTAEENLAVSVDENQIEQKKSNSSSLRSYKNGIKEDSDEEQFAIETTDEQMNENNSNIRNDNKNLKSKINLQHNDDQDLIQTKSVFRNDLTNVNEHSDNNLVTSNISSTTNEEKTQNKNTQASVPSVIWKENDDFLNELKQNNASQETTDKSSFLEKTKEQLGNFGRHLLDIPKYIFGRWVNRGKTAEENLAVSVDENQIEQKKSNSSSLRSYKNGIKEDSDEEQFAIETTDEQMNENNSNIRNDNKNLKSKINLQHNDDQDLIQTKSVFRNDLTNVNEHSDNNLVTSNISSTTNEEKTQNKNTQASVPSVIWKENDDFLNELKQNNASQETTDKSSFLEKTKEQLGNFGRHLLDIPKYIFGRWVNREKTAEENLAVSVDENQIEQKKSNSSSLRSYKNGIKEDSDDEQFARETTDEQMNENNSYIRNDNKNLKSKINLQHNDDQDVIQTKSVIRNDLTNVNEHSDINLVTSNISSTTNEEKTQNKNTQASVPSVIWKENVDFLNELKQNKIKRPFATLNSYPLYKYQKTINPDFNFYPDFFDARIAFPYCYDIIDTIADQSACGASWASAAASVMSDRRCIASKGLLRTPVSAEDLMSCCAPCGFGCVAGLVDEAFNWWATHGIVTGGRYNSNSGCKPYTLPMCSHYINTGYTNCSAMNDLRTPECVKKCNNTSDLDYESELTFGRTGVMWFNSVEDIQKEILSNGPVTANFDVYGDFITYTSGVYRHVTGPKLGVHTARIIGWGTDFESGTPYWIMANSWNENWGENGFFKIVRGKNECGVESEVFAALPKL